ncbi:hypothetical protein NQ318_009548 [Aromia moschata]|uniref:Uncharacterized protein n=1 Tax=Aromia moschata TaxID=1265417 RepID=A0AAV8Y8E4_9CUCU|nr:hypothetical protein NQ318_009548 [Aromia moschata]
MYGGTISIGLSAQVMHLLHTYSRRTTISRSPCTPTFYSESGLLFSKTSRKCRNCTLFYANLTFFYYLLFIITAYMKLFVLIFDDENRIQEIVSNLCITLLYSVTIMRVYAIRTKRVKDLIREVMELEQIIYKCQDEEVINIYRMYTRQSYISNITFLVNIGIETMFYFVHPLYLGETVKFNAATNETVVVKALPSPRGFRSMNRSTTSLATSGISLMV